LIISVVNAPAHDLARHWAEESVYSMAGTAGRSRDAVAETPVLSDGLAQISAGELAQLLLSRSPRTESEIFAFLQSAGERVSPAADVAAGLAERAWRQRASGLSSAWPETFPRAFPDMLLAASLLPFFGLIILRSRLFS